MNLDSDQRQNIQAELDFSSAGPGEAQAAQGRGTESRSAAHDNKSPARTFVIRTLLGLNLSNRRVRTRTHGGVAGVGAYNRRPYADPGQEG